jgi:serine/threonine-protein kinase
MANDQLIGRTLDGRYRIEALVARGGMATVYVASDLRLRRNVAIKVMHASLAEDHEFVHRFEREARAAAQLANPHVVAVHDQGHDAETGAIYLVMEYVVGRTVREIMAARGALTEVQALAVLDPVLQALAAAHDAGFVHRDVKPENVLVGDDGRIKVTDFGLARAIAASSLSAATQGVLIGTVAYLSPEQVERGYADARSDVYGAGVLLYEMLTGEVPHSGETPLAVAYQHVHADVAPPSTIHAGISRAVDEVVVRATRRDPQQRFQDARDFLAAVRSARSLIDPQYVAGPMPTPENTVVERDSPVHAPQRRRRLPARLALVSLAAIGIAVAGWWLTVGTHSTVPEVIGIPVSDAQASLKAVSLGSTIERTWNKTVPEGSVVDAQPLPGTSVAHGTRVLLIVSKGPERYEVPQLVGLDVGAAKDTLAAVKLKLGTTTHAYDESVSAGIIVSTNPEPGLVARPGDVVDIVVSKGPAPIPVPSVVGLSLDAADAALRAAGFATTSATSYHDHVATGSVIRTEPGSGTALQRGSHVKIVVSKGPAPVRVPDVFKMSQSKAESTLKAAGLTVKVVKSSGRLLNLVKSQTPSAGSVVPRGTTVTITIV